MIKRLHTWYKYRKSGLKKWHEMQAGKLSHFDFKLDNSQIIRLFPDSYLSYLILRGNFELAERKFVRSILKEGDVFIDIGANIGLFSVLAATKVGHSGKVLAFEPTPKTFSRLQENIRLNNLQNTIKAYEIAIGQTSTNLSMQISSSQFDAWNTLGTPSVDSAFEKITVIVEPFSYTLNQLSSAEKDRLKLVKIDVEGYEKTVFQAIFPMLKQIPTCYWMIEFNDDNFIPNGYTGHEFATQLVNHGFELYNIQDDGQLTELKEIPSHFSYMNIVARNR
jgi:FkbM family methyltransferase